MAQEVVGLIFLCEVAPIKRRPLEFSVTLFFATLWGKKPILEKNKKAVTREKKKKQMGGRGDHGGSRGCAVRQGKTND